jgi:Zn-dependent peptidase ImmA (M78 family)
MMLSADNLKSPRWNYVRSCADDLVRDYSVPPIPVLEIAEQNGVNVIFSDFGKHNDSVAGFCDFGEAKIYVNDNDNFGRKIFTIAHEFGHWILHRQFFDQNPNEYSVLPRFQKPRSNAFEQEANCFAAELLAPKHLLIPVKNAGVAQLAAIFGVSREMMEHRLKNV